MIESKNTDIKYQDEKGMTLIELMICIFLISVGILATMKMQVTAMLGNASAMKMSEATVALEDEIDTILGMDIGNSGLAEGNYTVYGGSSGQYTIAYTIQDVTGTDPDDSTATITKYKQITVTTTWNDGGKTVTMTNNFIKI